MFSERIIIKSESCSAENGALLQDESSKLWRDEPSYIADMYFRKEQNMKKRRNFWLVVMMAGALTVGIANMSAMAAEEGAPQEQE